jgi:hypothetical protein
MAQPWPAELQQFFNEDNFSYLFDDNTIRTDMEVGPQKVRRRFTKRVDKLTVSILATTDEYIFFDNYYDVTLAGGTIPFTFEHPVTKLPADFRFRTSPVVRSIGGGNFNISYELEILPV